MKEQYEYCGFFQRARAIPQLEKQIKEEMCLDLCDKACPMKEPDNEREKLSRQS